jgi:ABC-type arginine transport system permease subunit
LKQLEQESNAFSVLSLEVGQMQLSPTWESLLTAQIQGYQMIQEGIPSVIPVELCYLGWQESLKMLARVVEPDIPDGG